MKQGWQHIKYHSDLISTNTLAPLGNSTVIGTDIRQRLNHLFFQIRRDVYMDDIVSFTKEDYSNYIWTNKLK
jgi:hypothetical protein